MPRRYKLGPEGEMRRAWGGKLPEEFDQRDMLAFMAETDLQLHGAVSAETLSAIHAAGYDYEGRADDDNAASGHKLFHALAF